MKKEMEQKNVEISVLNNKVSEMKGEVEELTKELNNRIEEIKHFSRKTDEYIRYCHDSYSILRFHVL